MNKTKLVLGAVAIFVSLQMLIPNKSEAGMNCRTDFFGNLQCTGTGNDTGFNSTTRTDFFGNQNTTYRNNSTGQSGSFSCRTDFFGNYVCN